MPIICHKVIYYYFTFMLLNIYHIKKHENKKSQIFMSLTFYIFVCRRPIYFTLEAFYETTDKSRSQLRLNHWDT
jgi:hypothetical protein